MHCLSPSSLMHFCIKISQAPTLLFLLWPSLEDRLGVSLPAGLDLGREMCPC